MCGLSEGKSCLKKVKLFWFLLLPSLLFGFEPSPLDVEIQKTKIPGKYEILVRTVNGYGIQKDAPHRLFLSGSNGLQVLDANLKLQGPSSTQKAEYFAYVEPLPISISGSGSLKLNGKVFYCNYQKNLCISGVVQKEFNINQVQK